MRLLLVALFLATAAHAASPYTAERISVYAAGGKSITSWHGQADMSSINVEVSRSLSPRLEVGVVAAPHVMWQPRSWFGDQYGDGNERIYAASVSLLYRYRFFGDGARLRPYLEGSTGPMIAQKRVPAATSRFNFITQGGGGAAIRVGGSMELLVGYRFAHISNGGYSPRNPGLNVSTAILGIQMRR